MAKIKKVLYLTPDQVKRLEELAAVNGRNQSAQVARLIDQAHAQEIAQVVSIQEKVERR